MEVTSDSGSLSFPRALDLFRKMLPVRVGRRPLLWPARECNRRLSRDSCLIARYIDKRMWVLSTIALPTVLSFGRLALLKKNGHPFGADICIDVILWIVGGEA